jgi:TonB family protein
MLSSIRRDRTARGLRFTIMPGALLLLLAAASMAQQLPPPPSSSVFGAALHLSDAGCARPDARTLEAFARDAQHAVVTQGAAQAFPEEALRERLAGTVTLRLTYAANQDRPVIDVERSSGHAVLDQYAVALAQGAALRPPDTLRCRAFDVGFPLRFRVQATPADQP